MPQGGSFVDSFIDSFSRGQEVRRKKKEQEWAEEDRGIEQDILKHRLKELKIQDRLTARRAAAENYAAKHGTPESEIEWDGQSMKQEEIPGAGIVPGQMFDVPDKRMAPMEIPGIEELGIQGVTRQPQTMEQIMAQTMKEHRMKQLNTLQSPNRGERIFMPNPNGGPSQLIAEGQPFEFAPRNPLRSVERGTDDVEQDVFLDPETGEEVFRGSTRNRLSQRSSGRGGGNRLSPESKALLIRGFKAGRLPLAKLATSLDGMEVLAGLEEEGVDVNRALIDQKAMSAHITKLNQGQQATILIAADSAQDQLDMLEKQLAAGDSAGADDTSKRLALSLAQLASGGTSATNTALKLSEGELKVSGWSRLIGNKNADLAAKIKRLRQNLDIRTASIKGSLIDSDAAGIPDRTAGGDEEPDFVRGPDGRPMRNPKKVQ